MITRDFDNKYYVKKKSKARLISHFFIELWK